MPGIMSGFYVDALTATTAVAWYGLVLLVTLRAVFPVWSSASWSEKTRRSVMP